MSLHSNHAFRYLQCRYTLQRYTVKYSGNQATHRNCTLYNYLPYCTLGLQWKGTLEKIVRISLDLFAVNLYFLLVAMFYNIEVVKINEIHFLFDQIAMVRRKQINDENIGIMIGQKSCFYCLKYKYKVYCHIKSHKKLAYLESSRLWSIALVRCTVYTLQHN